MAQDINIDAGELAYCDPPLQVSADHDISVDTVQLGLGSFSILPTTWIDAADAAAAVTWIDAQSLQGTLLVGDTIRPASGDYWLYVRVVDQPETLIERSDYCRIRVTNTGSINYP